MLQIRMKEGNNVMWPQLQGYGEQMELAEGKSIQSKKSNLKRYVLN